MREPSGVIRVRAKNPSPLTLDGTNTYVVGGWVVDPGPLLEDHVAAVQAAAGEVEGVVLTHGHADHAEAADSFGVPVLRPAGGDEAGPFTAVATPGHSPDSVCLLLDAKHSASLSNFSRGRTCFTGDTVLGQGSVFIAPGEGSLSTYLDSLRRLRSLDLEVLCPGHGPYVWEPSEKIDEYIEHRLDRERELLAAFEEGARSEEELLDRAWGDAPEHLRPAAALTLRAHLEKLAEEGRLPPDVDV